MRRVVAEATATEGRTGSNPPTRQHGRYHIWPRLFAKAGGGKPTLREFMDEAY